MSFGNGNHDGGDKSPSRAAVYLPGTDGSNPSLSSGESTNSRFLNASRARSVAWLLPPCSGRIGFSLREESARSQLRAPTSARNSPVRDDQMMLGVDGHLHVVIHDARASAACGRRTRIRVSKRYLLVR